MSSSSSSLALLENLIGELQMAVASCGGRENVPPPAPVAATSAATAAAAAPAAVEASASEPSEKKPAVEKKKKEKATSAAPKEEGEGSGKIDLSSIDLRVGVIVNVYKHETADKLYCEHIDVGEEEPRQIASGLVHHYSLEEMQNRRVIVICNLKPRSLVGFKSNGMVLCAAKADETGHEKVELLEPPADAKPGDRVTGEAFTAPPASAKQCDKHKIFEQIGADLRVDENGVFRWKDVVLVTPNGLTSRAATLTDAIVR